MHSDYTVSAQSQGKPDEQMKGCVPVGRNSCNKSSMSAGSVMFAFMASSTMICSSVREFGASISITGNMLTNCLIVSSLATSAPLWNWAFVRTTWPLAKTLFSGGKATSHRPEIINNGVIS